MLQAVWHELLYGRGAHVVLLLAALVLCVAGSAAGACWLGLRLFRHPNPALASIGLALLVLDGCWVCFLVWSVVLGLSLSSGPEGF